MAIMSTYSSELIAVSSIVTYDIYKTYINPHATGSQLMRINYIGMVCFALFMAAFATGLYYIGISMGYLYVMMGVIISSAVLPASLTLLWSGQSWAAATFTPIIGFICAVTSWLVRTKIVSGELTVDTTGANDPMLVGNLVSLLTPVVVIPLLTYIPPFKPQNYDWQSMRDIRKVDDRDILSDASDPEEAATQRAAVEADDSEEQAKLAKSAKTARWLTVGMTLALLVLWPMPMYGSGYIFSEKVRCFPPSRCASRDLTYRESATNYPCHFIVLYRLGRRRHHVALRLQRHGHGSPRDRVPIYHREHHAHGVEGPARPSRQSPDDCHRGPHGRFGRGCQRLGAQ